MGWWLQIAVVLGLLLFAVTPARADTLSFSDLLGGGQLTCGDKVFFNFRDFSSVGTGGADAPGADKVFATTQNCRPVDWLAQPGPGLIFQSSAWNVNAGQTMDTTFKFDVKVLPQYPYLIDDAWMKLGSYATVPDGSIHITESITSGLTSVTNLLVADPGGIAYDHKMFGPPYYNLLTIYKDVSLEGHSGEASLSTFEQNFSQIPEPGFYGFVSLGLAALMGLAAIRRRS